MAEVLTTFSLVGRTLVQDVFNQSDLLLISAGSVLSRSDIQLLLGHRIARVHIIHTKQHNLDSDDPSSSIQVPLHNWTDKETEKQYTVTMEQTKQLFHKITEDYLPPLEQFTSSFIPLLDQVFKNAGILQLIYLKEGSENYTYRHSLNVGMLSALIAKLMNRSSEDIVLMGQAGLMHDVGKMLIPHEILMKPGKLTDEEYEIMKLHTVLGSNILQHAEQADHVIVSCALLHHERQDGTGYPENRRGSDLPLECQILSVADVFDAISSDRVYKKGTSPFEAARILWKLACEGALNPKIVLIFIRYIALLYVGSIAILNNGDHVEIVLIHTDEPLRPLVRKGIEYIDLRNYRSLSIERMIG